MLIRKATEKDFEQYFKLNTLSNKELDFHYLNKINGMNKRVYKINFLERIKKKSWLILIAEEKKHLIGFFEGNIQDKNQIGYKFKIRYIGYVNNVFIKEEWRKRGLFKKFQLEFEKYLKSKKVKYCDLHVSSTNSPALIAYKKIYFKIEEYKMHKVLK